MPRLVTYKADRQWLSLSAACRLLELERAAAPRILRTAGVRSRQLPGMRFPQCHRDDCEALVTRVEGPGVATATKAGAGKR
jgi:hypothetical protein